jgi:hypothetical protein
MVLKIEKLLGWAQGIYLKSLNSFAIKKYA